MKWEKYVLNEQICVIKKTFYVVLVLFHILSKISNSNDIYLSPSSKKINPEFAVIELKKL